MKIWSGIFINLHEIKELKLWIESIPDSFVDSHNKEEYSNYLLESRIVLNNINKLYRIIEEITGNPVDISIKNFDIGMLDAEIHNQYKQLVNNILTSNIMRYYKLKFGEEKAKFGISKERWIQGNLACKQYFKKVKKYNSIDYDSANKKYN